MSDGITSTRPAFRAVFALDVFTAGTALILLALATRLLYQHLKSHRFSVRDSTQGAPLKTALGTLLFLWPGLLCLFVGFTFQFVADLLEAYSSSGRGGDGIDYAHLGLYGRWRYYLGHRHRYGYSVAVLRWGRAFASIFFTAAVNGGVWIYSRHCLNNGSHLASPGVKSKLFNTFLLLSMIGMGLAAWARGIAARRGGHDDLYTDVVRRDRIDRILWVTYRAVVVAATFAVTVQAIMALRSLRKNAGKGAPERGRLLRFVAVAVPLLWMRNAFFLYDIALAYEDTGGWSRTSRLATVFLFIIFNQLTDLTIFGMLLWGAWRTSQAVKSGGYTNRVRSFEG